MKRLLFRAALMFALLPCFAHADMRPGELANAVQVSALPSEAQATLRLIRRGGPFPYRRDGIEFQNREHRLPARVRGYYHEYTVTTPNSRDRGARRIIAGSANEFYYSADHYRTFLKILP